MTPDIYADNCDDQLPLIARTGRGPRGDSCRVALQENAKDDVRIDGYVQDGMTMEWAKEWTSGNLSAGKLDYSLTINQESTPRTFSITLCYTRGGEEIWSFTTPAIPYVFNNLPTVEETKSFLHQIHQELGYGDTPSFAGKASLKELIDDLMITNTNLINAIKELHPKAQLDAKGKLISKGE